MKRSAVHFLGLSSVLVVCAALAGCTDGGAETASPDGGLTSVPPDSGVDVERPAHTDGSRQDDHDARAPLTPPDAGSDAPATKSDGGSSGSIPSDDAGVTAARARQLTDGIGINTHIDFPGYQTIGATAIETAIEYVGNGMLRTLRDSPNADGDLTSWAAIATATGVKFDAFIAEGAPAVYSDNLARMQTMAGKGYLMAFEGGNEEDDSYPVSLGNSQAKAAAFQPMVWAAGQSAGLPVFQISFGAGWSVPTGDYGTVGDLSASATYGNAHTYPAVNPLGDIASLDKDALLTTPGKPVAHTEFGWNTFSSGSNAGYGWCSEATAAAYDTTFILDAFNAGNPYYFRYELFDDDQLESANSWGMFYDTGTPKQSATALRVMFQLLGDSSAAATTFAPGKLDYMLTGMPASNGSIGGQQALFQRADGSFWLALWNEQALNDTSNANVDVAVAPVPITLTLATRATAVSVYDVLAQNTTPVQQASQVTTLALSLPAHPILVKIVRP
jgi:hypothetical protein